MKLGVDAVDTSFNYRGFTSHSTLAAVAGDLLPHLSLSTKVGYFPAPGGARHSLSPILLRRALEQTDRELGRPPEVVFLHNPEASVQDASDRSRDTLAAACEALATATADGLCGTWGIATWNPRVLAGLTDGYSVPRPSVLMVRAGLLVGVTVLDAAESLSARWGLSPEALWGMSPFGGNAAEPVWDAVDPRLFLKRSETGVSRVQAGFRVSFLLPRVASVAVGTDDPAHLRQLKSCLHHEVDEEMVVRYRELLRMRSGSQAL
ncbi:aldo/keto reductase [Kitasatospora sp. NPDC090091]|uniref:aldo/keto reductase n=1 Tax=Kitasatospora sp. NPDC090091 TaxID=3364081 RepID=UPI0037F842E5